MESDLMNFSMEQDENAIPSNVDFAKIQQTPQIVHSILKKSNKDNLIQLYTPVHKPGLKVQFQTPHSVKKSTPTRFEAVRKLDEKERWIERASILTKQDHIDYVMYASEFVRELVNNLPIDSQHQVTKQKSEAAESVTDMDVSMVDVNAEQETLNSYDTNSENSSQSKEEEEEDMETDDFYDAVDTQENVEPSIGDSQTDSKDDKGSGQISGTEKLPEEEESSKNTSPDKGLVDQNPNKPVEALPTSPPLPAKGSYDIDFDNLDDYNPFQTKSAVMNSPVPNTQVKKAEESMTKDEHEKNTDEDNESQGSEPGTLSVPKTNPEFQSPNERSSRLSLTGLQKVADNPFLKLIDSPAVKDKNSDEVKRKALDDLIKTTDDDILSQSFEDIDPFKPKSQIANSPVACSASLGSDDDPFKTKSKIQNSPGKPEETLDEVDPFKSKNQIPNSPINEIPVSDKDERKDDEIDEKAEDLDAIISEADESFSKNIKENDDKAESPDELDPFKAKSQIPNSPLQSSDPFVCHKQLANSPVVGDTDNPFVPSRQIANSPVMKSSQETAEESVKQHENPFETKNKVANSPAMKNAENLNNPEDMENPFKTKSKVSNSPVQSEGIQNNPSESQNPFATKSKVANSPALKNETATEPSPAKSESFNDNPESEGQSQEDPFKPSSKVANSPVSSQNSGFDANDPFKTPNQKSDQDKSSMPDQAQEEKKDNTAVCSDTSMEIFKDPAQLGLSEDDFKTSSDDYFWDPSAWEMLEQFGSNQNGGTESKFSRMSLFQKFDPLVDLPLNDPRRVSLAARRASIRDPKRASMGLHRANTTLRSESMIPEESICLFGTPTSGKSKRSVALAARSKDNTPVFKTPVKEKRTVTGTTPKTGFVDLLTNTPDNKPATLPLGMDTDQDDQTEDLLEIQQYTEADMRNLKQKMQLEFQGILLLKEKEWNEKLQGKNKETEGVQKELKTMKEEHAAVSKNLRDMVKTVQEYEALITEIARKEEEVKEELKETKAKFQKEKEQANEDIQSIDKAFSNLHKRYDKMKEVLEQSIKNEEKLKQHIEDCHGKIKKSEEKVASVKKAAEDKLNELVQKMEKLKTSSEAEIAKLKRKDMQVESLQKQVESLQKQVEQKTAENKELTDLCDQLIAKVGGS